MSQLVSANSVDKKMTPIGPSDQKLVFFAIFTIPNPTKHVSMFQLGPADSVGKKITEIGPSVQKLAFLSVFTIPNHTKHVSKS